MKQIWATAKAKIPISKEALKTKKPSPKSEKNMPQANHLTKLFPFLYAAL